VKAADRNQPQGKKDFKKKQWQKIVFPMLAASGYKPTADITFFELAPRLEKFSHCNGCIGHCFTFLILVC